MKTALITLCQERILIFSYQYVVTVHNTNAFFMSHQCSLLTFRQRKIQNLLDALLYQNK
jgi:hypothetical protein